MLVKKLREGSETVDLLSSYFSFRHRSRIFGTSSKAAAWSFRQTAAFTSSLGRYILSNASLGALHTGHSQSAGRSSNFVPSLASS
jgi:hypothetical protein